MRALLRQDPDIALIGEIRDKETAGIAIEAALTGHLVLSTVHTNNAISVVMRLIDMEIDSRWEPIRTMRRKSPTSTRPSARVCRDPKCVGIGEAGLDYHYNYAPADVAKQVFRAQIGLAREARPAAGHPCARGRRRYRRDPARRNGGGSVRGAAALLHLFARARQDRARARAFVSFSGVLTFKNSAGAARYGARDSVGTDAGRDRRALSRPGSASRQRNEPAFVADTARVLAEVKGLPLAEYRRRDCAPTR